MVKTEPVGDPVDQHEEDMDVGTEMEDQEVNHAESEVSEGEDIPLEEEWEATPGLMREVDDLREELDQDEIHTGEKEDTMAEFGVTRDDVDMNAGEDVFVDDVNDENDVEGVEETAEVIEPAETPEPVVTPLYALAVLDNAGPSEPKRLITLDPKRKNDFSYLKAQLSAEFGLREFKVSCEWKRDKIRLKDDRSLALAYEVQPTCTKMRYHLLPVGDEAEQHFITREMKRKNRKRQIQFRETIREELETEMTMDDLLVQMDKAIETFGRQEKRRARFLQIHIDGLMSEYQHRSDITKDLLRERRASRNQGWRAQKWKTEKKGEPDDEQNIRT